MQPNLLKQQWRNGQATLNAWLSLANPFVAELMAHQGFDTLTIDMQHGLMDGSEAIAMLQAIATTGCAPVVRVPWNEPGILMRMADAGAYAIICPMINSRAECEAFVGALRYPPAGYRSYGPLRARLIGGADYVQHANGRLVALAMIETAQALEAMDAIAATAGLDGIYVGPADLSISLGGSQLTDYTDPFLVSKLEQVVETARRHQIIAGLHCATPAYAARAVQMGFQFVTAANDAALLESGAAAAARAFRDARNPAAIQAPPSRADSPY